MAEQTVTLKLTKRLGVAMAGFLLFAGPALSAPKHFACVMEGGQQFHGDLVVDLEAKTMILGFVPYLITNVTADYLTAYETSGGPQKYMHGPGGSVLLFERSSGTLARAEASLFCHDDACKPSDAALGVYADKLFCHAPAL